MFNFFEEHVNVNMKTRMSLFTGMMLFNDFIKLSLDYCSLTCSIYFFMYTQFYMFRNMTASSDIKREQL